MANAEQVGYWDGAGGEHWPADQARYDEINRAFGERIVEVSRRARRCGVDGARHPALTA